MDRRSLSLIAMSALTLIALSDRLSAQSDATTKLVGTWVMDSTKGPGDNGLPKSETLVFSRSGSALRITATTDQGKGPSTGSFDCQPASGAAMPATNAGPSTRCTIRVTPDSVIYAIDAVKDGKATPVERGRLVVSAAGPTLRDEYQSNGATDQANHHRHWYSKKST
jgi:hypothetical protein